LLMVWAMPSGSVWLVALSMAATGGGFGLSWTFILRRSTALADGDEVHRIAGAIPVLQRLGYALGAAVMGIVANANGFLSMQAPADGAHAARAIFLACLAPAALALIAMMGLMRRLPALRAHPREMYPLLDQFRQLLTLAGAAWRVKPIAANRWS
jgi:Na+/melibiose symporter-like transporter